MKLTKKEEEILDNIQEGISDTSILRTFTEFDLETIKEIMNRLERLNLIEVTKKYDEHYKEDYWDAKIK
tara:strand:+ start:34 stop:240 length:207 start_codon:yes stop_codon:yes gene_type:complete